MDFVLLIAVWIGLYFLSDKVLDQIEIRRGERFENRSVVFFVILLTSSLIAFFVINKLMGSA